MESILNTNSQPPLHNSVDELGRLGLPALKPWPIRHRIKAMLMVIVHWSVYYCSQLCLHSTRNRQVLQFAKIFCSVSAANEALFKNKKPRRSGNVPLPPVVPSSLDKGPCRSKQWMTYGGNVRICALARVGASFKSPVDVPVDD